MTQHINVYPRIKESNNFLTDTSLLNKKEDWKNTGHHQPNQNELIFYTDAAYNTQTGKAGGGIVVISHEAKHYHAFSFTQSTLTANNVELATILKLTDVYQKYQYKQKQISIFTDSINAINEITAEKGHLLNNLYKNFVYLFSHDSFSISFMWILSHSNILYNKQVNAIA